MFSVSAGNWCCVVHASGAVREFGGWLFLDSCSAEWLLEKAETEPDESGTHAPLTQHVNGGAFHNFGPPSHAAWHQFQDAADALQSLHAENQARCYKDDGGGGGSWCWSVFVSLLRGKRLTERKYQSSRKKMVAFVNNRIWHFTPLAIFPDNCHVNCTQIVFKRKRNSYSIRWFWYTSFVIGLKIKIINSTFVFLYKLISETLHNIRYSLLLMFVLI